VQNFFRLNSELPEDQWRISLGLALGVHLLIVVFTLVAPYLLQFNRKIPEVYTVNLFTVEELDAPQLARPAQTLIKPKKTKLKKAVPKKTAPAPPPVAAPSPKKVVTTRPIKRNSKSDLENLKRLRNKLLTENKAKKAREIADKRAKDALESLKQAIRAEETSKDTVDAPAPAPGSGGGVTVDENTRRYLIAVNDQVQEHWVLPDLQSWADDLQAIIVIHVRRDGVVTKHYFESKSENIYFNQFVEKAINEASPLPPFPIGINEQEMEIGLRFRPGEIF
jgi:outer membrane biosynthesis protein TonB